MRVAHVGHAPEQTVGRELQHGEPPQRRQRARDGVHLGAARRGAKRAGDAKRHELGERLDLAREPVRAVQEDAVSVRVDVDGQNASRPVAPDDRAVRGDVFGEPRVGRFACRVPRFARAAERGHRTPRAGPRRRPVTVRVHGAVVVQGLQRVHVALPRRERRQARRGSAGATHRRVPRWRLVRDDAEKRNETRAERERERERGARRGARRADGGRKLRRARAHLRSSQRATRGWRLARRGERARLEPKRARPRN